MGKVKNWAWDCAEEAFDNIIKSLKAGKVDKETAKNDILEIQNLSLLGIDYENVDEVIDMEMEAA